MTVFQTIKRWYVNLDPVEVRFFRYVPAKWHIWIRPILILLLALPGIVFVESLFVNREWRSFDAVPIAVPSSDVDVARGSDWPDDIPVRRLSDILPEPIAATLPDDAAVPLEQASLTAFALVEDVSSINKPVSQSWLSNFTNPDGDIIITQVSLWCGYDLSTPIAERYCVATIPVPVFGSVASAPCFSREAFALYYALENSGICAADSPEKLCQRLPEWRNARPQSGDKITADETLQCKAAVLLPYITLTMKPDAVRVDSAMIAPALDRSKTLLEHQSGLTQAFVQLSLEGESAGLISWGDLRKSNQSMKAVLSSRARAAALFWTPYVSRHDILRGGDPARLFDGIFDTDFKDTLKPSSEPLDEIQIPMRAPRVLQAAEAFLGVSEPNLETDLVLRNLTGAAVPIVACNFQINSVENADERTISFHPTSGIVRLNGKACSELSLRSALIGGNSLQTSGPLPVVRTFGTEWVFIVGSEWRI